MVNVTLNGEVIEYVPPLTKDQCNQVITSATGDMRTFDFRLGQAIYNNLPQYMAFAINSSDQDMFHVTCDDLAYTMLLNLTEKI